MSQTVHPETVANVAVSEVTPEMIEAGVSELLKHDIYMTPDYGGPSMETWREAVRDTFVRMLQARA